MAWQTNVLVVANRTAGSDELIEALKKRVGDSPVKCTLLLPTAPGARQEARKRLNKAVKKMREAGIDTEGILGDDTNPLFCIPEVWDPTKFDEIVVSTLPSGVSHWLKIDLPQQVAKITGAPVEHVVSVPVESDAVA